MTLEKLLWAISNLAIQQKTINYTMAGSDIYSINGRTIKDYPLFFISPTGTQQVRNNTTIYTLTIYYLDRLLDDLSNDVTIMSVAIEELKNIIRGIDQLEEVEDVADEYEITAFIETEAFDDKLSGAYATIRVECKNETTCFIMEEDGEEAESNKE